MGGKLIIDNTATGRDREIEMSAPGFAKQCGVCHVGGGQMEYDRDMLQYGDAASTDVGGTYIYRVPTAAGGAGGIVATSTNAARELLADNKVEVDCMMCHAAVVNNGAAYYRSINCNAGNPVGPADNANCDGFFDMPFHPGTNGPNADTRFTFTSGAIYDSYNRNIATSLGLFKQAATAGLGATLNLTTGALSNVPATIPDAAIAGTPNSANCAMCHARTNFDSAGRPSIGLPSEASAYGGMTTGFGNFFRITAAGQAFDWDKIDTTGNCTSCSNDTQWNEFGCKTGMGKRAQRAGAGDQDRFNFGICLGCATFNAMMGDNVTGWFGGGVCAMPSVQAACNSKATTTLQGGAGQWMGIFSNPMTQQTRTIAGKMPDIDVHDAVGVKCATCHNGISGDFVGRTVSSGATVYTYPTITGVVKMDHQIAQGWSTLEKANDEFDGTVTCESCHIDRTHPQWNAIAGHEAPTPAHSGFLAEHLVMIDCRTCHIPQVYAAPGRLLFRDWTAGAYRQADGSNGNANHFQFMYNFMDGGATPVVPLKQWIKVQKPSGDEIKIAPGLPSMLPLWTNGSLGNLPLKTKDVTAAAALVAKDHTEFGIRINGTNEHPPFQGFQLADPWKIDSAAKINAMRAELATAGRGLATHASVANAKMNLMPFFFDPSHGVVEKELALGSPSAGGCLMCHSSSVNPYTGQMNNPATYSPYSVGFFDGMINMAKNPMMMMAAYDCGGDDTTYGTGGTGAGGFSTAGNMCANFDNPAMNGNGNNLCDAPELLACRVYIGMQIFPMFGMPADIAGTMDQTGFHAGAFPVDGVNMMQLMAIREGASAAGCDPRMKFFGMPDAAAHGTPGTSGCIATDYFSRDEIRAHFNKNLQQVIVGGDRKVFGNIKVGPTFATYDIGSMCYNPMNPTAAPTACTDGGYINTTVSEQLMLGYTPAQVATLTSMFANGGVPVDPNLPVARFTYTIDNINMRAALKGTSSLNTSGATFAWACPTGTVASGQGTLNAVCTFASAGTHTVSLTITNTAGSNTKSLPVTFEAVTSPPTFTSTVCNRNGNTITLNYAAEDPVSHATVSVFVNWGDATGQYITSATTHTYAVGTYRPYVTASNHNGSKTTVAACGGNVNITNQLGSITGLVTTPSGTALGNALITLMNGTTVVKQVYSDSLVSVGTYTITDVPFPATYAIRARLNGYMFADLTGVAVNNSTLVSAPTITSGAGTISGRVDNTPGGGVAVELRDASAVTWGWALTSAGTYTFNNVAGPGVYTIVLPSSSPAVSTSATLTTNTSIVSAATMTYN